ncbi:MAG: dephospho-CoA kinase [Candidatus Solincola sediminis]|uniref:Dephospho-CoA kinase n=1 Tax=Candidatus Solincola sediminis TaxID=1797199 RepID=A0A1F2WGJ3_9ACTN|nr:MAG: dephospho-CoA kinase [Candidatus Solincola sediminis]OFW56251.1 MAG: dephospho-CoA kinase [Candidatus Solincola sediminis]
MFLVALTGGIASGKSEVLEMLREKGANILDSDEMARQVVQPGAQAWREIHEHFGDEILLPSQELDRDKLAEIIFHDQHQRVVLNSITHPRIFELLAGRLGELQDEVGGDAIVVIDIPLLVEANAEGIFDYNLVVDVLPQLQVERLITERGYSAEQAWSRIRSQASREERAKSADYIVNNNGTFDDLRFEADQAWEAITTASHTT